MIFAFWKTVADCLVEFFDMEPQQASELVLGLHSKTAKEPGWKSGKNPIYHSEPIHIAADLAGREPNRDSAFYANYRRIQQRNLKRSRAMPLVTETDIPAILPSTVRAKIGSRVVPQTAGKVADAPKRLIAARVVGTR